MSAKKRNDDDWKVCIYIRRIVNNIRIFLGYTLINRHGYTVKIRNLRQVWDNPNRRRPYGLDDRGWRIKGWKA